jgi:hypothetical protein
MRSGGRRGIEQGIEPADEEAFGVVIPLQAPRRPCFEFLSISLYSGSGDVPGPLALG